MSLGSKGFYSDMNLISNYGLEFIVFNLVMIYTTLQYVEV